MFIFRGPVPVADKGQWPRIGGFPDFLYSNACRFNDGVIIIKHYHRVLNPWLQTINVSVSSERKELIIFDGFPLHLNIDLLKELGGYVIVALLCMTNTLHETNVDYLVTYGITKIEFKNSK